MPVRLEASREENRTQVRLTTVDRLAVAVLLTANFTLAVDFSILNVALPHIGRDIGFATESLQWIVTSFALCAAGFTLLFGRVADLFGRKKLFIIGIFLLGAASLAGGLAQDPVVLITARVGQGIATAMVTPAALSLMTTTFPEGPSRSRVLGLNGALMAAGFTAGAVLGGLLTGSVSWRWAFLINVAVAVAVLFTGPFVLREKTSKNRPKLDVPGAIIVTVALVALVFGIDGAGHAGWSDPSVWGSILAAIVLFVIFWMVEWKVSEPLVEFSLLRRGNIAWGNLTGIVAFGTFTSLVFLLTLYLQDILGLSAVSTGIVLGVLGVGTVIGGLIAPNVIGRTSSKTAIVIGLIVQGFMTLPLVFVSEASGWVVVVAVLTFAGGVANLLAIVGYVVTATAAVASAQQGVATGLVTMSQQVGITLGTPVMSAIMVSQLAAGGILRGIQLAIGVNVIIVLASALLITLVLRLPNPEIA